MVYTLEQISEKLTPILVRYGVDDAHVFGSYARGCANEKSDIDIVVKVSDDVDLLKLSGLRLDFAEILNKDVDLFTYGGLEYADKSFSQMVKKDEVLIYDRHGSFV